MALPTLHLPDVDLRYKRHYGGGNWLDLIEIDYTYPRPFLVNDKSLSNETLVENGKAPTITRSYEVCYRCHNKNVVDAQELAEEEVEAADIIALIKHPQQPPQIVLVVQFRPATGLYTIEWPSGLLDPNETIQAATLRELKEETGYDGKILSVSSALTCEPGMSSSRCCVAQVEIDGTLPCNKNPQPCLEADEWSLQTITLPFHQLLPSLQALTKRYHPKLVIDSRLYNYAVGLATAQGLGV
ncbi:hypothetical protein IWQ62_001715 [Dispira parvispora]|uniref:Nudix hydrolase domain-containing protein n=1 Tax=Dispira parvispora TaxID=1520584 RepID=A0A9W8ARX8_9FUNG|nr:hypothetical protein IWQ62_001715 [Dispira parvispora]